MHRAIFERQIAQLKAHMTQGGVREAAIRAMLYIGMADERGFAVPRQIRAEQGEGLTLPAFKALVRDQFYMLLIDEEAALVAIPEIARDDQAETSDVVQALRRVAEATGPLAGDRATRLARIEELFREAAITLPTRARGWPRALRRDRGNAAERDTKDKADAAE
jgi:hypothetical protein